MSLWRSRMLLLLSLGIVLPAATHAQTTFLLTDAKESYLLYKPEWTTQTNKALLLKFKTKAQQATLLEINYSPLDSAKPTDFKVTIHDGFLEYTRHTESRIHNARSTLPVADNSWHSLSITLTEEPSFRLDESAEQLLPLSSGDLHSEGHYVVKVGGADSDSFSGCSSVQFLSKDNIYEEIASFEQGSVTIDRDNCAGNTSPEELAISLLSAQASFSIPTASRFRGVSLQFRIPIGIHSDANEKVLLSGGLETPTGEGLFKVALSDELFVELTLAGETSALTKPLRGNVEDGKWHTLILLSIPSNRRRRQADDAALEKNNLIDSETTVATVPEETTQPEPVSDSTEAGLISSETESSITDEINADSLTTASLEGTAEADNNKVRLQAPPIIRSRLVAVLDGIQVELTDESISPQFKGDLRVGSMATLAGFGGCVRNVSIDGRTAIDLRSLITPQPDLLKIGECLAQGCASSNPCKHSGHCVDSELGVSCNCANTGYAGKLCTLPLLMESCADLFLAGERRSGVHLVDVDGSGPRYVYCSMNATESRGVTTISHNLPSVELKNYALGGAKFQIKYRNLDQSALKRLTEISDDCQQSVTFKCRNAPLKLGTHTWFRSIYDGPNITNFGSGSVKNCDLDDGIDRVDEGYFSGKQNVPIASVNIVNRNVRGKGVLQLGPLECHGKPGTQEAISFMSKNSFLNFPTLKPLENFRFYFKTFLGHTTLLHQNSVLRLALANETCVTLYLSFGDEVKLVSSCTAGNLNNGGWHLVKVEFGFREVQLTVDLKSSYYSWDFGQKLAQFTGPLSFGAYSLDEKTASSEPGVIGCIKGFFRDSQAVNIATAANTANSHSIGRECVSSCKPDTCQNNAECFDKFGDYDCICSNPVAHSGRYCEDNINVNPVTFGNASASYIQFQAIPVPSVLNESILLSFRTHSPSGLLLYAHDHLNNFVQIHIQGGNQLVVSFNLLNRIQRLSVNRDGLTDGKWHQVQLNRTNNSVSLEVDFIYKSSMELSAGFAILTKYTPRPWPITDRALETVWPPRPNVAMVPFQMLYLGGIKRPEYTSSIPGFYGCLRGVKIGDHLLDLTDPGDIAEADRERDPEVIDGCHSACESTNPCSNGGLCVNKWGNLDSPADCRCDTTSYGGSTCSEDTGAAFNGTSRLVTEYKPGPAVFALDLSRSMRFRLAFSTNHVPNASAALLLVQFSQRAAELLFSLTPEGFVKFDLYAEEASNHFSQVIEGNFTNGQRHHLILTITSRAIRFQVDDNVKSADLDFNLSPVFVHYVSVGGVDIPVKNAILAELTPYEGCLSNVIIDSPISKSTPSVLEPLKLGLRNEELPFTAHRFTGDILLEEKCAVFASKVNDIEVPHSELPTTDLTFPAWEEKPAVAEEYHVAAPKPAEPPLERNTGIIIGVICGVFLLAVLIAILVYMCRLRRARRNHYDVDREQKEDRETEVSPENDHLLSPNDIADAEKLKLKPTRQVPDEFTKNQSVPYNPRVTRYIEQD